MRREIEARDRSKNGIMVILVFMLLIGHWNYSYAQNPNCSPNTPYFYVDLSLSPTNVWSSPNISREGQCCGAAKYDNCISFDVVLNPNTAGIQIDMIGADPAGSLFYQINCAGSYPGGSVKCISGAGPHHITFCKPGGNKNVYKITAVSRPLFPADDTVRIGCKQKLISYGVGNNSVTWQSIYPGTPGQYNSYLDSTNVASPTYSAAPNAPAYVDYKVCGMPVATMCGYTVTVCDTVRIYNFQSLTTLLNPNPAAFCNVGAGSGVTITATPGGGQTPYQYIWKNTTGTLSTNSSYFATAAGVYSVEIRDVLYNPATCPSLTQTISVMQGTIPVVDAGVNKKVCASAALTLNGSVQFSSGGTWSGGTGNFTPSNSALNANYQPSASELSTGFTKLYLTSSNQGSCPIKKDSVYFYFSKPNASLTSPTLPCNTSTTTLNASSSGGFGPYSYSWSTGGTGNSIQVTQGQYTVTSTDSTGCVAKATRTLTAPSPISTSYSVQNTTCFGLSNGSINLSVTGGVGPYTYTWSNSSHNQDLSNISAGTYTAQLTDANHCYVAPVLATITEPTALAATVAITSNYNGFNISCPSSNDGSASVVANGGTGAYTYSWNTTPVQNTASASGLPAGTYSVTITDANGCKLKKSITLVKPPKVTASVAISQTILCTGGTNGEVTATANGGAAGYTYVWNTTPVQTGTQAVNLPAGNYNVTITDANNCSTTKNVTFVDPTPVNATAVVSQTVHCLGGTNGAASVTAGGGAGGYSYSWNTTPVQTSAMAVGLPVGAYNVTVTDANGCSTQATVAVNPGIVLNTATSILSNYNGQQISCAGASNGSASVNVSGGAGPYTYSWNTTPVQTSATATNLGAGTYVVTIADINNCLATASVTIVDPSPIALSSAITSQSVDCNGYSTGSAAVSPVGGVPGYTYSWSTTPAQTSANALNLSAGNYNVTVTDANGCIATASVAVIEPSPINIVISDISNYNGFNTKCNGDATGSVDITVTGGIGAYIYQWSNGAYTEDLSSIPAGAYNVVVTDANGCVNTITFPVTQPGPIVVALDSLSQYNLFNVSCNGSSDGSIFVAVSGGANNYTYNWSNGETTKDITNLTAGYYSLGITDQNGCKGKIRVSLNEPDPILLSTTSTMPDCNGMFNGSINVSSSGGVSPYQYNWSNGAATQNNVNIGAGTYTVVATDMNGCIITEVITLNQPDKLAIVHAIKDNKCFSDSTGEVTSTVSGGTLPYNYIWSNGSTNKDISNIPAGTYSVSVTDVHGCNIKNTIIITQPDSLHVTLSSPVLYNGHNISLHNGSDGFIDANVIGGTNPYTFLWSNSSNSPDQYNLHAGTYNVVCADANGCKTIATIALSQPSVLEMPTGFSPNTDGANDLFVVHGIEAYPSNFLTIYNRWGNIVFTKAGYANDWTGTNNEGQALPAGTYFALLEINGQEIVLKGYVEIRK